MNKIDHLLCHKYAYLIKRWRALCKRAGLKMEKIENVDGYPCYEISSPALRDKGGIYLSAGIHGDEPAAVLGLLLWAEKNIQNVASLPLLIYPCLNPWGVENNSRWDANGLDLNRLWDGSSSTPLIARIMQKLSEYTFSVSACLHEDYEALGTYLYAPGGKKEVRVQADAILKAVQELIPRDTRRSIDGRKCTHGMIFPRPSKPPKEGIPEALFLYENCGGVNFTLETPSELGIDRRSAAHACMIEESLSDSGLT